jgi:ferredoxin
VTAFAANRPDPLPPCAAVSCTFCLDCIYACPHENIGILSRIPAEELGRGGTRSGIGNLNHRSDWTALIIVFTFGALVNAFAMVSPVYQVESALARISGLRMEWPILAFLFAVGLVALPLALLVPASALSRRVAMKPMDLMQVANHFARSLIPLGFGMWLAHYGFHFFTGALTAIPVSQLAVRDCLGWPLLGEPQWQLGGIPVRFVFPLELGFLMLGLMGSIVVGTRLARQFAPHSPSRAFAPWGCVQLVMFALFCWVLNQPMEMRGVTLGG